MALQTSGAISLNDIHVEAGGSSGTTCTINDSDIRGLISKGSGAQMSFNEWYGASGQLNIPMMLTYFYDVGTYGTTRQLRFRKYVGVSNQGSMSPNYWTLPNGNKLEWRLMYFSYPSNGVWPSNIELQAVMLNSSGTVITPTNTGWTSMKYVSANDGRTLVMTRSEMTYNVGTNGTNVITWSLGGTTGTSTQNSTLYFEYANPNNNETGTLEVVI